MNMKRPSPKELYNKILQAKEAITKGSLFLVDPHVKAADALSLGYLIDEIGEVLSPITGTQSSIPLRDIATIRKGYVEPIHNPAYYNGHQASGPPARSDRDSIEFLMARWPDGLMA